MGLLDALFQSDGYGGQNGGLLDLIRNTQMQQQNYQPSPGFAGNEPSPLDNAQWPAGPNGAPSSASFADRFNAVPNAPQPFSPAGRPFDSASFDPQTFAPNQAQPIAIGSNYQMPRLGNADQFQPAQAMLPPNAQPAQGQLPQGQQTPQQAPQQPPQQTLPTFLNNEGGLGAGVRGFFNNFGGGPLAAIIGGLGSAAGMQDPAQQNMRAQYENLRQALIDNGETPKAAQSKAMAAVLSPKGAETILPELFSSKQDYGVISDNPIEGKKYGFINKREQTINGKSIDGGGTQSSGGLMASGASYNPNLSGDAYLAQFSPEVQAAAKAYINGDVLPSGNPRQQGIASQAKTIAQKYGADMGIPVSDALYSEKRKYRTELGTNSANSAGGQAKAFNQGISHMTSLADNLEKLDNSNGLGIPAVAGVVNAVRQGVSNEQSAIADEASSIGQTVAGEVGKLFSGSAGGGVHERELTRERFDTVKSKPQLAAALRATLETMDGGLKALEQRRDSILGPNSGVELVSEATKANIAKIQGVIDRLEGKSNARPSSGLPSGWSVKVR